MVDFSCALKLSMPYTVLSAIREAGENNITVKGGKFLEAVAQADTIVFDKTGTLTHAAPKVVAVKTFGGWTQREILKIGACLEEHYPHSMANSVVKKAKEEGIRHDEMHTKVQYIVAHGIASTIADIGQKAIIGFIMIFNGSLIAAGAAGLMAPATSSLLHNTSTIVIGLHSMTDLNVTETKKSSTGKPL